MRAIARRPRDAAELAALLRLRGEIFSVSWMAPHCTLTGDGLEVDAWDARAHHLGVWVNGVPVGVVRLLQTELVSESARLLEHLGLAPRPIDSTRIPALEDFFPGRPAPFVDDRRVLEISRFGLAPAARGAFLAPFLAWTACAWALTHGGLRPVVFRVPLRDAPAYRGLVGAIRVGCTERRHYGTSVGLLRLDPTRLPDRHRERIVRYAAFLDARIPIVEEVGVEAGAEARG